jgi:hypothetical protein
MIHKITVRAAEQPCQGAPGAPVACPRDMPGGHPPSAVGSPHIYAPQLSTGYASVVSLSAEEQPCEGSRVENRHRYPATQYPENADVNHQLQVRQFPDGIYLSS